MAVVPQKVAQQYRDNVTPRSGIVGDNVASYGLTDNPKASRSLAGDNPGSGRPYGSTDDSLAARVLGDIRHGGSQQSRFPDNTLAARVLGDSRALQQTRSYGASDENMLRNQILETHDTDSRSFAVRPVLHIIEVIFHRATADVPGSNTQISLLTVDPVDEKALHAGLQDMLELPTRIISAIACEVFCKSVASGDVHNTTMDILRLVRHYNWDAKAVLAVAAFAVSYGEFRLVANLYPTNPLAKAVALLKQLPEILELTSGSLKPKLEALFTLVRAKVDVTNVIVEFFDIQRDQYFSADSPETVAFLTLIPTAVYWVIRSTVVSASQILGLTGMGHEYISEAWELSSLAHKLKTIHSHLSGQLDRCYRYIEKKKDEEAFKAISTILESSHLDNSKPLRVLFYAKDDQPPLYDGHSKRRVGIEELRRKVVVLFITGLEIPQEDYTIIHQMYQEKRTYPLKNESQYEMVWVPLEESWTQLMLDRFERSKEEMDWLSVYHPSVVSPVVARYIRHPEKWRFNKKPIFVVLDTQGRVVHKNAMHMMCIWGSVAYPFSETKEKLLWEEETWKMDLLADAIDPRLTSWIQSGKYICLFGGEDIEWIRKFTRSIRETARESNIPLELLYVGKTKPKERIINDINAVIEAEKLATTMEWSYIWYFWLRIESMWYSKGQLLAGKNELAKNDPIMLGIIALLSFGSGTQGWALISRGSLEMTKGTGEHMHTAMVEHGKWKLKENEIGFVPALDEHLRDLRNKTPHHCTSLILPAVGAMPETVACAECGRLMERFTMFRCCAD
ncbi:protein SIEVE ELEMENT OCCLUSION B [Ziziphus jujuba]|uniref:Protein SIEVE ELEMENT OCCLUSION B n=2 Tax=Ziziphus jujuba TaxID=326968 RepID=A0A6P4AIC8_ZIZJJ|nr:protein SIEVE ELEMENT OCCLUSION B [Ziziphus jujuba]KAH7515633.1 hypothetical protein FEM48_Zijuj10G0047300 [Ziziphus jujuba var. spinosa]